jgi:hypothetical protein
MIPFFRYKPHWITIQLVLITLLVGYSTPMRAQGKTVRTVIQQTRTNKIEIEYQNDNQLHCNSPIKYTFRKTGTTNKNQVLKWTIRYVSCNSQTVVTETINFPIKKGSGLVERKIDIKTRNLVSSFDENSLVIKPIDEPEFTIAGPASIMEGDEVNMSVQLLSASPAVKWVWSKGSMNNRIGEGASINQTVNQTTRFYAYAMVDGLTFPPREFVVNVIKRPDAPADFTITGPVEITDIEKATLEIKTNSTLQGVKWIWTEGDRKVGEGLKITVSPRQSTSYAVHSEYFRKKSPEKTFPLKVRVLPEPPGAFTIAGPDRINDGERVWLRIVNPGSENGVKWRWLNEKTKEEKIADSILVNPGETTMYSLTADLNGKLSGRKNKTIEVIQKAVSPEVVGTFKKCVSFDSPLKFTLQGGKLGTGSRSWTWYEGECGSGKLIHRGNELTINPYRTTTYYVQPDNNRTACRQFTIEVGDMPVLPERLTSVTTACYNQVITVEAVGARDANTNWKWYAESSGSLSSRYIGEGTSITDTITRTTQYSLIARNNFCESVFAQKVNVEVNALPIQPPDINVHHKKGRIYILSQIGGSLPSGYQWVWYRKNCNGKPVGYGEYLTYRARKSNTLLVRAEGNCEPTACTSVNITHPKSRFIFINFGLASNNITEDIFDHNAQFTIGSNSIYVKGRAPLSLAQPKHKMPWDDKLQLETDDSQITNYPANTNSYYTLNGRTRSELYSLSGGFLLGGRVLKIYLGGGYGERKLYWGADIFDYRYHNKIGIEWARHQGQSISGPMVEGGVLLRLGFFNISGGMNIIMGNNSTTYRSFDAGIGFTFKRKDKL